MGRKQATLLVVTAMITHYHISEPDSAVRAADTGGSRGSPAPRMDGAAPSFLGRGVVFNCLYPRMGEGERPASWFSHAQFQRQSVHLKWPHCHHPMLPSSWTPGPPPDVAGVSSSLEPCMNPFAGWGDSPCSDQAVQPACGAVGAAILMADVSF